MVFKEYNYGSYKKEIKKVLYNRLIAKQRMRYHSRQLEKYKKLVEKLEVDVEFMLKMAEGKEV